MLQAFVITLREGLEAFLIVAISLAYLRKTGQQQLLPAVRWGILASVAFRALLGTIAAAVVAWLWSRYGHRVNLSLFFQVTAVFLAIFVVQLFIYGFHELTEANLIAGSQAWHDATEPYGPDGIYGKYLS